MKKPKSSLPKPSVAVPLMDNRPFGKVFLMKKDGTLTPEPGLNETQEALVAPLSDIEMRKLIFANRAVMFGEKTVGLSVKLDNLQVEWDAILFDFSDAEDPRSYILKATKGIVPSMQSMIAINSFLDDPSKRTPLIEAVKTDIEKDKAKLKIFKPFIVEGYELGDMLNHVLRQYLRGLFLINEDDADCVKVYEGYTGARSENLTLMFLRKFIIGKSKFLSVFPEFTDIPKWSKVKAEIVPKKEKVLHTEDHHFAKATASVRSLYEKLKRGVLKIEKGIIFNPNGSHYVSMKKNGGKNLAFFHFRRNAIYLVVKMDEKVIRKMVKKAEIKSLPPSVQKFWNGASTGLVFSGTEHLKEVTDVLKRLIKQ